MSKIASPGFNWMLYTVLTFLNPIATLAPPIDNAWENYKLQNDIAIA